MFLCLCLVVFVHGFSQDQLNASLFIFSCFFSWFFSQNQLLCFFVYLLLCLFMVSHRTNSYASLFTSCCILFMVSHFLALITLTVRGDG
jgi:hypothetical protein